MFYGAISIESAPNVKTIEENIVLLCESSNLYLKRHKIYEGTEIITFGRWEVKKPISLLSVILYDNYIDESEWLKEQRNNYLRALRQFPSIRNRVIAVSKFIAEEFGKPVKDGGNFNYMISAVFTQHIMENAKKFGWPVGGILYPSLQAEGSGLNVAIHPDWVDDCLELTAVLEIEVHKKGNNIATNNLRECKVEAGKDNFVLEEFPIGEYRLSKQQLEKLLNSNN